MGPNYVTLFLLVEKVLNSPASPRWRGGWGGGSPSTGCVGSAARECWMKQTSIVICQLSQFYTSLVQSMGSCVKMQQFHQTNHTGWGGHLFRMFCKLFSESSTGRWVILQLPCCPSKKGELLEHILQNLPKKWPPHLVHGLAIGPPRFINFC